MIGLEECIESSAYTYRGLAGYISQSIQQPLSQGGHNGLAIAILSHMMI